MKIKLLTEAVILVAALSLFCGLTGCKRTEYNAGDVAFVSTSCGHMDYSCSYSFYIVKKGENWLFSADCATDTESERIQFEDLTVSENDAKELLSLLEEQNEIDSLKSFREPKMKFFISDETTYSSAIGFSNGEKLFAKRRMSDETVNCFYRLSRKYKDSAFKKSQ